MGDWVDQCIGMGSRNEGGELFRASAGPRGPKMAVVLHPTRAPEDYVVFIASDATGLHREQRTLRRDGLDWHVAQLIYRQEKITGKPWRITLDKIGVGAVLDEAAAYEKGGSRNRNSAPWDDDGYISRAHPFWEKHRSPKEVGEGMLRYITEVNYAQDPEGFESDTGLFWRSQPVPPEGGWPKRDWPKKERRARKKKKKNPYAKVGPSKPKCPPGYTAIRVAGSRRADGGFTRAHWRCVNKKSLGGPARKKKRTLPLALTRKEIEARREAGARPRPTARIKAAFKRQMAGKASAKDKALVKKWNDKVRKYRGQGGKNTDLPSHRDRWLIDPDTGTITSWDHVGNPRSGDDYYAINVAGKTIRSRGKWTHPSHTREEAEEALYLTQVPVGLTDQVVKAGRYGFKINMVKPFQIVVIDFGVPWRRGYKSYKYHQRRGTGGSYVMEGLKGRRLYDAIEAAPNRAAVNRLLEAAFEELTAPGRAWAAARSSGSSNSRRSGRRN